MHDRAGLKNLPFSFPKSRYFIKNALKIFVKKTKFFLKSLVKNLDVWYTFIIDNGYQ